ncbi:MAG TPA: hypothetical protein VKK81_12960 [Candidatus Binatia bacterium]|nr:hypothetical protein [Candidatus Binatia bacterium]
MRQGIFILLLAVLTLPLLTGVRSESFNQPHFFLTAAVETAAAPTDVEPVPGPPAWHLSLRNVTPRGKGTLALLSLPLQSIAAADASLGAHLCPSASTVASQTTPLYQSLQVFRF